MTNKLQFIIQNHLKILRLSVLQLNQSSSIIKKILNFLKSIVLSVRPATMEMNAFFIDHFVSSVTRHEATWTRECQCK
jgi:hypothetical protein